MPAPKYDYVKLNITTPNGELLEQIMVCHHKNVPFELIIGCDRKKQEKQTFRNPRDNEAPLEFECVGNVACEQELLALIRQYVKWPKEK